MTRITRNMSDQEIKEAIQKNLEEYHTEKEIERHKIITSICNKCGFDKHDLARWFLRDLDPRVGAKRISEKLYAKPRKSFTHIELTLAQTMEVLHKSGFNVKAARFSEKTSSLLIKQTK